MERKVGKVDCKGSYREYIKQMEDRGSNFSFVKEKQRLSNEELSKFGRFKGYVGKDVDTMEAYALFNKDNSEMQSKTKIIIEDSGYTTEEINEAVYKAYKYLEKLERKDPEKSFVIYKNSSSVCGYRREKKEGPRNVLSIIL